MQVSHISLVSVIIPTYNSESYIASCITSVKNQTYKNWEILITDDNSSDRTVEIIKSFINKDSRIKLFRLSENMGAAYARNKSIEKSNGRFIAFLDSDDQWLPKKLEKQLAFMKSKQLALSYTNYKILFENKNEIKNIISPKSVSYKTLLKCNYIGCLTVIYDTKYLGKKYFPLIKKRQDWALWLDITKSGIIGYNFNEPLSLYLKRKGSISSNKISLLKYNWLVYYKHQKKNFLIATLLLIRFLYYYVKKRYD